MKQVSFQIFTVIQAMIPIMKSRKKNDLEKEKNFKFQFLQKRCSRLDVLFFKKKEKKRKKAFYDFQIKYRFKWFCHLNGALKVCIVRGIIVGN